MTNRRVKKKSPVLHFFRTVRGFLFRYCSVWNYSAAIAAKSLSFSFTNASSEGP